MSFAKLKVNKKQLRSLIKQRLLKVSLNSIQEQSSLIYNTVTKTTRYQNAKRIGVYLSMPTGEVQTDSIVRDALNSGKQVFIPFIYEASKKGPTNTNSKSLMEMVKLDSLADYESLQLDRWGIPSIDPNTFHQRERVLETSLEQGRGLDIIFVPGVAFQIDPQSQLVKRLGHGKGYYDSFLDRYQAKFHSNSRVCSQSKVPPLYGLSLIEQNLSTDNEIEIPMETHDYLLRGLAIGDGKFHNSAS